MLHSNNIYIYICIYYIYIYRYLHSHADCDYDENLDEDVFEGVGIQSSVLPALVSKHKFGVGKCNYSKILVVDDSEFNIHSMKKLFDALKI